MRPFEIVLISIFGAAAIGALIFVSIYKGSPSVEEVQYGDRVEIWGTFDNAVFSTQFTKITQDKGNKAFSVVTYVQKNPESFANDIVDAIAEGKSPDLILLPHEELVTLRTKLQPISFNTFSERSFRDRFVDGAEIFLFKDGVYGVPLFADPLVLYWNRDLFSSAGLATPPRTWEQLVNETVPALTRKDAQFNVTQSAISLGEFTNITNAKRTLAMLFLQSGSTLVEAYDTSYRVSLNSVKEGGMPTGDAVLSFYTQFSNPTHENYTWNRSLKNDRLMFLGGELGMYVGRASEYPEIEKANPNLNFDVAPIPQGSTATVLRNYADFYALVIPRASENQSGAYAAAQYLAGDENAEGIATALGEVPVSRSLIAKGSVNPFTQRFYESVLIARGWLDPNPKQSIEVFRQMVQNVTSGKSRVNEVLLDTRGRLELLFK